MHLHSYTAPLPPAQNGHSLKRKRRLFDMIWRIIGAGSKVTGLFQVLSCQKPKNGNRPSLKIIEVPRFLKLGLGVVTTEKSRELQLLYHFSSNHHINHSINAQEKKVVTSS
jgi:hypothetical protein